MQFLGRVVHYINITGGMLAGVAMVLMMVHITVEVGGRYFFNARMVGTLEVVSFYYMVILVFLGFGYVESRREHIRVDLFVQMMPVPVQFLLYVFACLLGLWFFGMLFWQSLHDALTAMGHNERAMANFRFYIWPARWALPLGFASLCLAILANLLTSIGKRRAL
jgi:TRAP-type C4-dicarboxylate transport system permease small subunit